MVLPLFVDKNNSFLMLENDSFYFKISTASVVNFLYNLMFTAVRARRT